MRRSREASSTAEERSLLLCERGQEQIAERHPVQLLTLFGLEPVGEEAHEGRVALGEDRQRAPDVARRRHVEGDADLPGRAPGVGHGDEAGDVLGVAA